MGRIEHVLTVFAASPSDVEEERGKLEEVVRELNTTWSRDLGVRLELLRWETHAYPGVGEDAQAVINDEVPNDYDLFIGIMWWRYGTKTARAGSGTVEEFERAKSRYEAGDDLKIMVYFKDEAVPPSRLDPNQLGKVHRFRESLGKEGVLHWKFKDLSDFERLVRLHLTRQVQAFLRNREPDPPSPPSDSEQPPGDGEDLGLLDLIELFEKHFAELTDIATRIGSATEQLGTQMSLRTEEMSTIPRDVHGNADRGQAKRVIALAAADMDHYRGRIEAEIPLFRDSLGAGMDAFQRAAMLSVEMDTQEDAEEVRTAVTTLRRTIAESSESTREFRDTIADLPRMTSALNKARRGVTSVLDRLLDEFASGDKMLAESGKLIDDLFGK